MITGSVQNSGKAISLNNVREVSQQEIEERRRSNPNEYFLRGIEKKTVIVNPGEYKCVSGRSNILVGEVGSGVLICTHDCATKVGSMANLIIPESYLMDLDSDVVSQVVNNYLEKVLEKNLSEFKFMSEFNHREHDDKEIRISMYGGSSALETYAEGGLAKLILSKDYLAARGARVVTADIGGNNCRRIHLDPERGEIKTFALRRKSDIQKFRELERAYRKDFEDSYGIVALRNSKA